MKYDIKKKKRGEYGADVSSLRGNKTKSRGRTPPPPPPVVFFQYWWGGISVSEPPLDEWVAIFSFSAKRGKKYYQAWL